MSPRELVDLLICPGAAADLVEAISVSAVKRPHGLELTGWRCEVVPWGVRFCHRDGAEVLALAVIDLRLAYAYQGPHRRGQGRRVILLG